MYLTFKSIFILQRNVIIHQDRLNARVIMDFMEKIVKTLMNAKLIEGVVNIIATTLRHNGTITHFDRNEMNFIYNQKNV